MYKRQAYRLVTLTNLDGTGTLTGDYANIRSSTGDDAYSPENVFVYGRSDDRFEQVMAYYWITEAQKYFQELGFGTTADSGAIGEGFGDYLAVTVSAAVAPTPDAPCVADWDSTSYTPTVPHCLRRVDGTKHYPEDLASPREVHADGEIWSRALWDIRQALGARTADTIILEGQFDLPDPTMPELAASTVAV